jgi:polar amino acid transport system substrate-binding protein
LFFFTPHLGYLPPSRTIQVRIGHSMFDYPPMHFHRGNELVGLDIDIANAVAEIISADVEFVRIDWSESTDALASGEVDVLWGGLERASLDERIVRFTRSYMQSNIVLLMTADRGYNSLEDIRGLDICALNFTPAFFYLQVYNRDVIQSRRSFTPPEYQSLMGALSNGEFDVMLTDVNFASFFMSENSGEEFRMSDTIIASNFAVGVRAEDTALFDLIQGALDELERNGTIAMLINKWIG